MAVDWPKADIVLACLKEGRSLRASAASASVSHSTVLYWRDEDPVFADQYARAREIGYNLLADELIEISDDSSGDVQVDKDGNERLNGEFVARSRLRVDTRKWMLAKMLPKVYGEKIDHNVKGGLTVTLSNVDNEV